MLSWRILESRRRFTEQAKEEEEKREEVEEVEEEEEEEGEEQQQEVNTHIKVRGLEKANDNTFCVNQFWHFSFSKFG